MLQDARSKYLTTYCLDERHREATMAKIRNVAKILDLVILPVLALVIRSCYESERSFCQNVTCMWLPLQRCCGDYVYLLLFLYMCLLVAHIEK
jgi:hypothetical protein